MSTSTWRSDAHWLNHSSSIQLKSIMTASIPSLSTRWHCSGKSFWNKQKLSVYFQGFPRAKINPNFSSTSFHCPPDCRLSECVAFVKQRKCLCRLFGTLQRSDASVLRFLKAVFMLLCFPDEHLIYVCVNKQFCVFFLSTCAPLTVTIPRVFPHSQCRESQFCGCGSDKATEDKYLKDSNDYCGIRLWARLEGSTGQIWSTNHQLMITELNQSLCPVFSNRFISNAPLFLCGGWSVMHFQIPLKVNTLRSDSTSGCKLAFVR